MELFNKLKSMFADNKKAGNNKDVRAFEHKDLSEFERIISGSHDEIARVNHQFWDIKVYELSYYKNEVVNWPDKKKVAFIIYMVKELNEHAKGNKSGNTANEKRMLHNAYVQHLFRAKLLMEDVDVKALYSVFSEHKTSEWSLVINWPVGLMLNQLAKQYQGVVPSPLLKETLLEMKEEINSIDHAYYAKEKIKLVDKIDSIIFSSENDQSQVKPVKFLGEDDFSKYANEKLSVLPDSEKLYWYKLIASAQKASGSKPSKKYLDETKAVFKELGSEKFKRMVNDWFSFLIQLKEKEYQHSYIHNGITQRYSSYDYISSVNIEAIKGFVWICSHFHDSTTINTIAKLAERSFKKIPGRGPAAAAIGNACLFVLYQSKGLDGIGQLSRLRLRIKQSNTQSLIEKYLQDAAKEQGISIHEIEDLAVDDYGLQEGSKEILFEDYKAVLSITGVGKTEIKWYKPDGSLQKSVPSFVKDKHAEKLKKLKETAKQVEQTVTAQRDRIDRMFRSNRKINWRNFQELFLQHGLMCFLSKNIIWNFEDEERSFSAICINRQWINNNNEIVHPGENAFVSLWHPATVPVAEVRAWRDFLAFHTIQQPLKQAFREVYLLTDAEVNTRTYSNRMAAHVLKQHQFNSLAKTRGWKYSLLGAYDDGRYNEAAEVKLPEFGLKAEYWINEVNADDAFNDTGIWNYIATDQVRFINTETNELVELVDVPAIPFSEVMRDVDLFVGVASVGNDPTWQDSGGIPAYRDYWQSYSFGDLSEVAKVRKDILTGLVPRLKISKVAEVKDKFLVVKGKLRTYKIHIGSTNILMEPNDQYLCIVPDRSQKSHTENLFLPFEGDAGLSFVLSKAFLLADDDQITDTTITSQINRK